MEFSTKGKQSVRLPKVIPPETIVQLTCADEKTPEWRKRLGKHYRVGYYSRKDGLNTIWLVDDRGRYCETTNRKYLLKYFKVLRLSQNTDYFGVYRRPLRRLSRTRR